MLPWWLIHLLSLDFLFFLSSLNHPPWEKHFFFFDDDDDVLYGESEEAKQVRENLDNKASN